MTLNGVVWAAGGAGVGSASIVASMDAVGSAIGPWWITLLVALIAATPPTVTGLVLIKRLGVVHTAVNSTQKATVDSLAEAKQEIADLREIVGKLKEREG